MARRQRPTADGLRFAGTLPNGLAYEARLRVLVKGGTIESRDGALELRGCDEAVVLLAAGTSYVMDYARHYQGQPPGERLGRQLQDAAERGYDELLSRTWRTTGGCSAGSRRRGASRTRQCASCRPIGVWPPIARAAKDPELEALLFQMGRYLLIACSRQPGLPANLQGLWNDSNTPAVEFRLPRQHQRADELLAGRTGQPARVPPAAVRPDPQPA